MCHAQPTIVKPPEKPRDPCYPSPCGPNAHCRVENTYGICECLPEYHGNPYEGCRPECLVNSDCPMNRACIRNKCKDPCPGTCGLGAICTVSNHIPICACPEGYSGDAFRQCNYIVSREPPRPSDPCTPSPCGLNTICRSQGTTAVCECLPGFHGSPSGSGCRPECTISADCPLNKACSNTKCIDPCPGVCGFGAKCQVVNHSPVCSCPIGTVGDPFTACTEAAVEAKDPCYPNPCSINGQCRAVNGQATCTYPECIINQDCPRDKACYSQKCRDPCIDACGVNAICQAVNHRALCQCPPGYVGTPEVICRIQVVQEIPKPECTQDVECRNDLACINNKCRDPCQEYPNSCGQNAECRVQLHRPLCTCRNGFTGNAQAVCYEIGCRTDSECPPTQACVNKECTNPCSYTQCGQNALCRADSNHRARCYCPDNYRGDPNVLCSRPECVNDDECPFNLACRNERCEDPCKCGSGAVCSVNNHRAICSCPPGYTGNPLSSCTQIRIEIPPQCTMDADCSSKLACFSGECRNPCHQTKPCGANAECLVVDTLPLRTMSCVCLPGYVGDADIACQLVPTDVGCKSNDDCPQTDSCINRQCVNPCVSSNPCAISANCQARNHKAHCTCPTGLIGDPFIKCYEVPKESPECTSDSDCDNDKACTNQRCQDPCVTANPCGTNAQCRTSLHRPKCTCPDGWGGNPQIQCYKPQCKSDSECPFDKACIKEKCLDPCLSTVTCGRNAECKVQLHRAQCVCPQGMQGNPLISCISVLCQYNEDCADHESCDRLNRVCRPVCDDNTCAQKATCVGRNHQPICTCQAGLSGNPYFECRQVDTPVISVECRSDSDCQKDFTCVNSKCENPCLKKGVCAHNQECRVLNTLPLKTIMCQCPKDTIADENGFCKHIAPVEFQCQSDLDCHDSEKCYNNHCTEACRLDPCGVNAQCNSQNHRSLCTCAPGYTGNPHVECTNVPKIPFIPSAECFKNDDCPYDRTCINERCVNPCREDRVCGRGAFCYVREHQPICTCPTDFGGNAKIECIPPDSVITVGCRSNSECPKSDSCINGLCISPCNCGENAECRVTDHYPICFCKPGYSGNPQTGCFKLGCQSDTECHNDQQCYNGQCLNPCILGNPCATNAECYGNNHRAACKCPSGYSGNPFERCERVECRIDTDCPLDRTCIDNHCVNPCSSLANPPCASNAVCFAMNHAASCRCPEELPEGNPLSYCERKVIYEDKPECKVDSDCPSKMACVKESCVNPCLRFSPCSRNAECSVLDTVPVRTMICTCPDGWVSDTNGECSAVIIPQPPGCTSNSDCPSNEACINRLCRNPCDCGDNAECHVQNHHPVCSCKKGFEGNPNIACHTIGCRSDSECDSGKACVNGNCINPCIVKDPCGINAECNVNINRAECKCLSGYRGNPYERCTVVECRSNSDCPSDRQCINAQCINPCIYDNPCSPKAECRVQNYMAVCRCPAGFIGNPYVDCHREPQLECTKDADCPTLQACLNNKCQNPCTVLQPCQRPAECQVVGTLPVRTMNCLCPSGYISSGSGTCQPTTSVIEIGGCITDSDCPNDKSCDRNICRDPCNCGVNADCRVKDHRPICTCKQGYDGNPEIQCVKIGCRSDDDCSKQHSCINRQCIPVCSPDGTSCGANAICHGFNHRAVCDCPTGFTGDPKSSCILIGCRSDTDCPTNRACINQKCESPCEAKPCDRNSECRVFNHKAICICPPGFVKDSLDRCVKDEVKCRSDSDCPTQKACINDECVNPCNATEPCGVNADCKVLDTLPVRTMICECKPGYQGNAAVQCDKALKCSIDKGYIQDENGNCVCPPNYALNQQLECIPCPIQKGLKIDENGQCVCALERGMIINERGQCVCPTEYGYRLDINGNCSPIRGPECETDFECPDHKYCDLKTKTCVDPCVDKICGTNALCNATNHKAICQCLPKYTGDPNIACTLFRTDFPQPNMEVSCLSDGVQVKIDITDTSGFNGVLYVKGHSKDEQCRRVINLPNDAPLPKTEFFKVHFGSCGLIHVNGQASFVLVVQKHPKLVTYKAQAYHIKCLYQTGEQNVTLGFNVSMLTTAGTIANTGPPPTCTMKIVTQTGQEISAAEIGDNLMLQVDVQPGSIYGGFARSCVAKTMEDKVENEYIVTDENGCATDPAIFGDWEYNPDTQSLLASFNAFKFPSSDNIRFQCNIRVCFGKCQPVNCRGYDAYGRKKRSIDDANNTEVSNILSGQLREEITIESNAILTFERREERFVDPTEAPDVQKVEDICVSMIGFIIALVITALLALVAVAVAVSCWLMAYRRRPKAAGPLPHPPEFPNPMFTTPEPMAEPSPDYLT